MKALILAGGTGTRLWPLSRTNYPKQFLKLKSMDKSLFQLTFERCLKITCLAEIFIVTNISYKFLVQGQVEELGYSLKDHQVLIEPFGKNTLPAIYFGVKEIQRLGNDVVVVFPSDHMIENEERFLSIIQKGISLTPEYVITFGIEPTKPHTGYGYIKPKKPLLIGYQVDEFKEKPDLATAKSYLEMGYLWNSGMFMFRTDLFVSEVKAHMPQVYQAFQTSNIMETYEATPSISIDYGLLEKSSRVAVIPVDVKWSDLGSFDTLYSKFNSDQDGNISFSANNVIDAKNNLIYTDEDKAIALIGVNNLIVVDQKDALLICQKDHSQRVKELVDALKEKGDPRADFHLTTYRPWGSYTILEEGLFYKIKRITVLPSKKLSYQLHHHRSEHWVVVKGTAKVIVGEAETFVRSGESTFVQTGCKHRLENPGKVLLEVIEVQLGEYLEEDDIVRFDDDFGRAGGCLE